MSHGFHYTLCHALLSFAALQHCGMLKRYYFDTLRDLQNFRSHIVQSTFHEISSRIDHYLLLLPILSNATGYLLRSLRCVFETNELNYQKGISRAISGSHFPSNQPQVSRGSRCIYTLNFLPCAPVARGSIKSYT